MKFSFDSELKIIYGKIEFRPFRPTNTFHLIYSWISQRHCESNIWRAIAFVHILKTTGFLSLLTGFKHIEYCPKVNCLACYQQQKIKFPGKILRNDSNMSLHKASLGAEQKFEKVEILKNLDILVKRSIYQENLPNSKSASTNSPPTKSANSKTMNFAEKIHHNK